MLKADLNDFGKSIKIEPLPANLTPYGKKTPKKLTNVTVCCLNSFLET